MITVHHLNNSRSQRVLWLLEELGVPYEIKRYERNKKTMLAPEELKAVHPLGKSPVITDGDITVAESGAIVEYIVERYGHGRLIPPAGTAERMRYVYFMHYAEGSAMPPVVMKLVFMKMKQEKVPFFIKPILNAIADKVQTVLIDPQLKTHFDFLESELGRSKWFAGDDFTAADIQMSFPIEAAKGRRVLNAHPRLDDFLDRIRDKPAYQRAIDRGGRYELGF